MSNSFDAALAAHQAGRIDAAVKGYRRVLNAHPRHAGALTNLASLLKKSGGQDEALGLLRRAIELPGAGAETWFNFGNLLRDLGNTDEAVTAYRHALCLQADLQPASVNLARLLVSIARQAYKADDAAIAEQGFGEAARLQPGYVDAHIGHGMALKDLGRRDEAIACWRRALETDPRSATAHNNLGALYRLLKRPQEAVRHLRESVALAPGDAMAAANLAHALLEQGATTEALQLARGIVERDPQSTDGHMMVGFALTYRGEVDAALDSFVESHRLKPESGMPISNALFASLYSDKLDAAGLLGMHRGLAARIVPASLPAAEAAQVRGDKLKIGYLSPDMRSHPVSAFFEPILSNHDMHRFDVHCYSTTMVEDAVTARLRGTGATWHACADWSAERIAKQIRSDGIDILVDLAGHTAQNRAAVLRAKPAPVQALYIGYPGTSGLPEVDYFIADERVCPSGHERFFSEKVIRVDGSFWCFRPPQSAPRPAEAPMRRNGYITFGSFNALQKLSPTTMALWIDVLRAAPDSRLVLKSLPFADESLRASVLQRFTGAGIDGRRIDILPPSLGADFLAEYGRLDVALDPTPYNGGTTTFEALWMGVPVISMPGERFASRMGGAVLANIGMHELIADSAADYVAIATRLAVDPASLERLRRGLRERMAASPCCDGPRAARELEAAFLQMAR